MLRDARMVLALLVASVLLFSGQALALNPQEGGLLQGRWFLVMYGAQCCSDGCWTEPYCASGEIVVLQNGCDLIWINEAVPSKREGVTLPCPCEPPVWERLTGFLGCGKLWMTSGCYQDTVIGSGPINLDGKVGLFGHLMKGQFQQMIYLYTGTKSVVDGGQCAVKGDFIAIKISSETPTR